MMTKKNKITPANDTIMGIDNAVFERQIAARNLVSTTDIKACSDDFEAQIEQARETLKLFKPQDAQQLMLAAQLNTIHDLQQHMAACARISMAHSRPLSTYINAVTKLSNAFTQQLNLYNKLQGKNQQKVTVEHVNVEAGGQAIVGHVEHHGGNSDEK